jgi:lysophospholipase L1-like esterase
VLSIHQWCADRRASSSSFRPLTAGHERPFAGIRAQASGAIRPSASNVPVVTLIVVAIVGGLIVALAAVALVGRSLVRRRRRFAVIRLTNTIPVNAKWWHEQELQDGQSHDGELLYVAVGDSAAQGIGASHPGRSYVGMLAAHLRARTNRPVRVINLSQSGARLREALAIQLPKLPTLTPDVLTVSVGANDIAAFEPVRFERELRELYAALPPHAIVADLPSFYLGRAERNVLVANAIVRRIAAEFGLAVAPLHAVTRRQGVPRYTMRQVAADFFHPNDRGYRVWASAFRPLLDSQVPATPSTATED